MRFMLIGIFLTPQDISLAVTKCGQLFAPLTIPTGAILRSEPIGYDADFAYSSSA